MPSKARVHRFLSSVVVQYGLKRSALVEFMLVSNGDVELWFFSY